MRTLWISLALWALLLATTAAYECPLKCDPDGCAVPEGDCFAGMIRDRCNCCMICGRREGERCFKDALKTKLFEDQQDYPDCGEHLECRLRTDLEENDRPEAICYCTKTEPICGSDGETYANECQFTEARYKTRNDLFKQDAGPCKSVPQIVTPPEDITNNTGSSVAFSCEVKGWPVPSIEWWAQSERELFALPSDNKHISVQSRGGPSEYEVTSWLQLMNVERHNSGLYICIATNSEGQAKASASLTIGNFKKNFPIDNNL